MNKQTALPKTSLLAILAPFLCLLPLNIASVFVRNTSSHITTSPFSANDIVLGIIANLLILGLSYKCFPLYMHISIKDTILWEMLLTFILLISEFITFIDERNKSWLYTTCLFFYSLIWPTFKLRHQLYLHKWSEKSNRVLIYTSAICIQMLPNVLGRITANLSPSRLHHELILLYCWLIPGLLVSLALYFSCNKMNYSLPEISSEEIEKPELPKAGKKNLGDVLRSKKLLFLFVVCIFCGMSENKSQSFVKLEDYSGRDSGYFPIELFEFSSQTLFLACEIGKVVIVARLGWLFGKLNNKKKILNVLLTLLFGIAALYYYLLISKSKRDLLLVAIFGKQGLSELIHLVVQLVISEEFYGSPEVFFASNALFSLGDLLKRVVDPIVLGWISGLTLLIIFMLVVVFPAAYLLKAPSRNSLKGPEKKMKLG